VTKYRLKEYDSALHWHQQALDVRVALYGKEHASSADCYYCIAECQCEMQDYDSALESYQQALDVRLKLYGHNHADTANSYYQIGRAQLEKKDYKSALQSFEQALGTSKPWILGWRSLERNTQPPLTATPGLQDVSAKCKIMILLWSHVNRHLISG
jgi:tetratricopeptide (TPR) repeat protein